jgi:arginase
LKTERTIQIVSAPSILGLKPTGVQKLPENLLSNGLLQKLNCNVPVIELPTLNEFYSDQRDRETLLLNGQQLREFSVSLHNLVLNLINSEKFPLVLGGDCSIIIGIMSALKAKGNYGLLFLDAHADFYEPEQSTTGEVADMDLAIVTGRGPDILANIHHLRPYVTDTNVVHIGQRDEKEAKKYGARDIKTTAIRCFDLAAIRNEGIEKVLPIIIQLLTESPTNYFWIHFDTDVLADDNNPAVDYRLPGGLKFEEVEKILKSLLKTGKISGMSITIFNPLLDKTGEIGKNITDCISRSFAGSVSI